MTYQKIIKVLIPCVSLTALIGILFATNARLFASPVIEQATQSGNQPQESNSQQTDVHQYGSAKIDGIPVVREMTMIDAPGDIEGLTKRADLIVVVKVKQSLGESVPYVVRNSEGGIAAYASLTQADVRKVIKGDRRLIGKSIPVAQELLINRDNPAKPVILASEKAEPLVKGGRYIMYLERTLGVDGYAPIAYWAKYNTDGTDLAEERILSPGLKDLRRQVKQIIKDDQP
jgi:hypothetical protein